MGDDFVGVTYGAPGDTQMMTYGKASFLLDWNGGGGAFIYQATDGSDPANSAWTASIGQPAAAKQQVGVGWMRQYTDGVVLVNPDPSNSQTFSLGGSYLNTDGTIVTSVTLAPDHGPHPHRRVRASHRRDTPATTSHGSNPRRSPASARAAGWKGTSVTITGSAFTGASAVTFNGVSATFSVDSPTSQITATVPSGATSGPISVTTADDDTATSAASLPVLPSISGFSPTSGETVLPSISGFSPTSGEVGTSVEIDGSGFSGSDGGHVRRRLGELHRGLPTPRSP